MHLFSATARLAPEGPQGVGADVGGLAQ